MHLSTNLFIALALVLPGECYLIIDQDLSSTRWTCAFLFIERAFALVLSTPATTEQLKEWIMANRKSIYGENSITGDGDLAGTILRLFGLERTTTTGTPSTTTQAPTTTSMSTTISVTIPARDVCPFAAEPLMLGKEFAYCRPSSIGDCPVGYLCDQSFVLSKSICCRDNRLRPMPNRPVVVGSSSARPPFSWNTITPTVSPKWNALTTAKKTPWYIKDRTTWPSVYNRMTPETTVSTTEETLPTITQVPLATTTMSTTTTTPAPSTTAKPSNPWARVWTTTRTPHNAVSVSVLQAGSIRTLRDGQSEAVGAITLINDNGFYVLVNTGASSDTERLLHGELLP
ncbi:hypothetical protein OSTOST_00444 [Ostertagia ostertagi]